MSFTKSYFSATAVIWLTCNAAVMAGELTAAEKENLQAAWQGTVVMLNELWAQQRDLPPVPVEITDAHGPQFLFSDKPEYFYTGNGIALQEEIKPGVVRLYLYHVPEPTNGPKTISAVIENLGAKPMEFRFLRYAFPDPGKDYHRIGKAGLVSFFNSQPEKSSRLIPPGGRAIIDTNLDRTTATTDELVHGFYEFEINQPARVTVFQRDPDQASLEVIDWLPKIPRQIPNRTANGAGRGLFLTSDFKVRNGRGTVVDTASGPVRLALADGRNDRYIQGHDSMENVASVGDSGNYGVLYHIRLEWSSSDGRSLALLMTKTGGNNQYCHAQAGAVQVNAGVWAGGTVAIPSDRVAYGSAGGNGHHPEVRATAQGPDWHD